MNPSAGNSKDIQNKETVGQSPAMLVFKFGGASVNSVERIQKLPGMLERFERENILIVISAMGKTTNALEKVVEAFFNSQKDKALELFAGVKAQHIQTAAALLKKNFAACDAQLRDIFTEVEWLLHDKPVRDYDYYYDQIVCCGELLSTAIVSSYLNENAIGNQWIDVRDIFRTDDEFRDASIDWDVTQQKIKDLIQPLFKKQRMVITQGFIGATDENESTTLGREGSDYSAAIFANLLDADSLSIWKDVEGVMNADPKQFPQAQIISKLNYDEVIEMAFYGAQVIHPKTIKPLQNKNIPLNVKCFLDPDLKGTLIHNEHPGLLPPIIVVKDKQALMKLHTRDYSFIGEQPMSRLYEIFGEIKLKPNLLQNAAVSLLICLDDRPDKIEKLALAASVMFEVMVEKDLKLLTIRHYTDSIIKELTNGQKIVLQQQTEDTVQFLIRETI